MKGRILKFAAAGAVASLGLLDPVLAQDSTATTVTSSLSGLPLFLAYFCLSLVVVSGYLYVYTHITQHDEFELINANVPGAAVSLGLSLIGFALPVASAVAHAANIIDCFIWSVIALIVQLIGHAANTRWFAPLRRVIEAPTLVFPVLILLGLPIAIDVDWLYPWVDHPRHVTRNWLEPTAFALRGALYLAVFTFAAELLRRWSRRRDAAPAPIPDDEEAVRRERMAGAVLLPPVGLAITFASFDWLMSLDRTWYSTMFGVYVFAGGFSAALALIVVLARRHYDHVPGALTGNHFHALGRLLLAFVIFWTYTAYFQGFLIQIADKPVEITFYVARTQGGWTGVLWAVLALHFALPFLLLLPRRPKFRPRYLAGVALLVLAGHVLDFYWIVVPASGEPLAPWWADLAALVGIAGTCVAFAAWRMRGVPVVPTGDPFLATGIRYASPT